MGKVRKVNIGGVTWVSLAVAADRAGFHRNSIYRAIRKRKIPMIKVNGRYFIKEEDVKKLNETKRKKSNKKYLLVTYKIKDKELWFSMLLEEETEEVLIGLPLPTRSVGYLVGGIRKGRMVSEETFLEPVLEKFRDKAKYLYQLVVDNIKETAIVGGDIL